ncbi:MAG TPA: glycogen-binding domain-containing protein [Longimicrobiales bacterium]|nr:glycogen-binding domain-containing protein [Longimicrobiales bacterium]
MRVGRGAALGVALAGALVPAVARGQEWRAEAQVGRFRYDAAPSTLASTGAALGLDYDGRSGWLRVSAGLPFASGDPVWGAAGAGGRLAARRGAFSAGVDLAGQGFVQREDGTERRDVLGRVTRTPGSTGFGGAAQVLPMVGLGSERVAVELRGGASLYTSGQADSTMQRTVRLADARVVASPARGWAVAAATRVFDAPERRYVSEDLTATVAPPGRVSAWATVGKWLSGGADGVPWGAGARLELPAHTAVEASARRTVLDPLYLSVPRTSWSVAASVRLAGPPRPPAPVPARYVGGRATVLLPAGAARGEPKIAGDWNGWRPEPMTRAGESWSYTTSLAPGVYYYAFVASDGRWYVPESVPGRQADGMGGETAVLVVK